MPIPADHARLLAESPRAFNDARRALDMVETLFSDERFRGVLDSLFDDAELRRSYRGPAIKQFCVDQGIEVPDEVNLNLIDDNWCVEVNVTVYGPWGRSDIPVAHYDSDAGAGWGGC